MWLIGAMVCLLAAPLVQLSVSAGNGWPHNALRYHWLMPISCHFRDCKALLVTSLTHVSGAITSVQTFTLSTRTPDPIRPTRRSLDANRSTGGITSLGDNLKGKCFQGGHLRAPLNQKQTFLISTVSLLFFPLFFPVMHSFPSRQTTELTLPRSQFITFIDTGKQL